MSRKKHIAAGVQFILYQAGGPARKLLKRHLHNKVKQTFSGIFRKTKLLTSVKIADRRRILVGINAAGIKTHRKIKPKKQKLCTKALARILKYALQETRYS